MTKPDAAGTSAPLTPHAAAVARRRQADERVLAQSTALIAQTRGLDARLSVATQTDRQLSRRAASLVTQLARRLSVLLSRAANLLPMVPGGGNRRINHYVVHAERSVQPTGGQETSRVRMLTIGSNGMLRVGSTDSDATGIVWTEYDPTAPAAGWDLESVIERLSHVVARAEGHVDAVESRVLERSRALTSLEKASVRRGPSAPAPAPLPTRNPISPLLSMSHGKVPGTRDPARDGVAHSATQRRDGPLDLGAEIQAELREELAAEMLVEPGDAIREMDRDMERELDAAMSDAAISDAAMQIFPSTVPEPVSTFARPVEPPAPTGTESPSSSAEPAPVPGSLEDATARYERSRAKRQLFDRLR